MAKNYLKQFTEWVTGSKNNLFLWTRLKLASFYIIIIALVMIVFSMGLYVSLSKNIKETINDKFKGHALRQVAIEESDDQVKGVLIAGNVIILFFFSGLGFFLAGRNLRPIEDALEKQKRFAADASHDLRTPLAIMKTDCEVSLKKKNASNEELRSLVKSNLEEIDRMSAMVNQLLFLSRNNIASKQQFEPIALGRLTEEMVKNFKNLAEDKNISLSISKIADSNIKGNQLEMEKMLLNILKNAIDYTPAGGKIEVSVQKIKDKIKLSVKDTGIGIAPENLPHVIEAFYKADVARSDEYGGSGLGLSIVKKIIEDHHGNLEINSKLGVGTEISVFFPVFV